MCQTVKPKKKAEKIGKLVQPSRLIYLCLATLEPLENLSCKTLMICFKSYKVWISRCVLLLKILMRLQKLKSSPRPRASIEMNEILNFDCYSLVKKTCKLKNSATKIVSRLKIFKDKPKTSQVKINETTNIWRSRERSIFF